MKKFYHVTTNTLPLLDEEGKLLKVTPNQVEKALRLDPEKDASPMDPLLLFSNQEDANAHAKRQPQDDVQQYAVVTCQVKHIKKNYKKDGKGIIVPRSDIDFNKATASFCHVSKEAKILSLKVEERSSEETSAQTSSSESSSSQTSESSSESSVESDDKKKNTRKKGIKVNTSYLNIIKENALPVIGIAALSGAFWFTNIVPVALSFLNFSAASVAAAASSNIVQAGVSLLAAVTTFALGSAVWHLGQAAVEAYKNWNMTDKQRDKVNMAYEKVVIKQLSKDLHLKKGNVVMAKFGTLVEKAGKPVYDRHQALAKPSKQPNFTKYKALVLKRKALETLADTAKKKRPAIEVKIVKRVDKKLAKL